MDEMASSCCLWNILDIWGRPQGMALMLLVWTLGFIMMAACKNVFTYAAAQVFSTVGSQGISYCLTVFIADTSSLKSRGLMLAFATSPYIVTTWIGGPMGDSLVRGAGWRWGFGIFSIITPVVVLPLIILFWVQLVRAKKQGLVSYRRPEISPRATFRFFVDMDLLGILFLAAGMALILIPLSIGFKQKLGWKDPKIIAMTVVGAVLLVIFVAYERFLAPVNFVPFKALSDRTILFAGLMLFFLFFNSAVWGSYFTSMLMVVWNLSVTKATYISNIYRVGSCFSALVLGYLMRVTGRFKWVALYYGMPLMLLGVGLMIHFRRPDAEIGYVVMTQIFVAFAGGPLVVAAEMAFMAPVTHQNLASILAILDLFSSIGYAVGATVSGAIWTGCFPDALRRHLPEGANIEYIYSSIYTQLGYPVGTEIRKGISWAYADAQRYMVITSTCALAVGWGCVLLWRDIKVKEKKQVGGNVA
ncbi:hypothetical protein SMACR_09017 [Sordaria macrospora]|uniref:Major facilitator superfamily (MFS) profile domain-containing protein n=1 Tax=Sordaria macrospora TaxID=5147 RepID=A0A8S9A172_SORMA|nr:hypothetical protein SMACR_09017 [Sordaria macrospora]WPJ66241.1 hypothetical protein SMAC4_09017 [Sordaria macrospora]